MERQIFVAQPEQFVLLNKGAKSQPSGIGQIRKDWRNESSQYCIIGWIWFKFLVTVCSLTLDVEFGGTSQKDSGCTTEGRMVTGSQSRTSWKRKVTKPQELEQNKDENPNLLGMQTKRGLKKRDSVCPKHHTTLARAWLNCGCQPIFAAGSKIAIHHV
jgi:hypothetical protein